MLRFAMIWVALVIGAFVIFRLDELWQSRIAPPAKVTPTNVSDSYVGVAGGDCDVVLADVDESMRTLMNRIEPKLAVETSPTTLPDGTRYFVLFYTYSDGQRKMFYVGSNTYRECRRLSERYAAAAGL